MNNLMCFESQRVEIIIIDDMVLFNPYDVGKCLDLSDSSVRRAIQNMSKNQVVKLRNSNVHNMNFRKLHNTGENFLTESGVYKLVFKSRKKEAEKFTDWIADDVLPSIRKNGKYELTPQYELKRKTYLGIPVMTSKDVAYLLGMNEKDIQRICESINGKSVTVLKNESLKQFKVENKWITYPTWHLSIYYAHEVFTIFNFYHSENKKLEKHLKDYFKVEHTPTYITVEEKKLALEQARYLVQCGNHLNCDDTRELAFKFATAILINIGSWHEGKAGFKGITSNWDIDSLEGWNKICLL